jgi:hypothetical protein
MFKAVTAGKRGELAEKFDSIHTVQRAMQVGSVDCVIQADGLRPYLIEAVERGINRELARQDAPAIPAENQESQARR